MEDRIEKKNLIEQLHHIWNSGEVEAIPEVYSTNFIAHWPKGFAENESHGFDGAAKLLKGFGQHFQIGMKRLSI